MRTTRGGKCGWFGSGAAGLLLLMGTAAQAGTTWYVSKAGSDTNAGNVVEAPLGSVTNALTRAANGDLIAVAAGIYTQSVKFAVGQSNLVIRGGYEPGTWIWSPSNNVSTIRGSGGPAVSFTNGASGNLLATLSLTSGGSTYDGVLVNGAIGDLTLDGVTIFSSKNGFYGSSSFVTNLLVKNSVIARNSNIGLNVVASSGQCYVYNSTIFSNGSHGVHNGNANGRSDQGAIVPVVKNCIIAGNFSNSGNGINKVSSTVGGSIQNSLFHNNRTGAAIGRYLADLGGNKSGRNPEFVDPVGLDFRLTANSPAAGAGEDLTALGVTTDIVGTARPQGSWDMGAYESAHAGELPLSDVVHVSTNGSDSAGDGSTSNPWASIGYGLGHVAPSGTVRVAGGVYNEVVDFGPGHRFTTIKGGFDPVTWDWAPTTNRTLVNGSTLSPIQMGACADTTTVACLTLTGGTSANNGGIVFKAHLYGIVVDGCTMVSNLYGVTGVLIRELTVRNSIIAGNTLSGFQFTAGNNFGGGTCYIYNSTITGNGMDGYNANSGNASWGPINPVVKNTLFTDNGSYGINRYGSGSGSMSHCLFYNNATGTTSGSITDLGGNKSGRDPLYADAASFDFRVADNSPAAAAGTNIVALGVTNDIVGTVRPGANGWDMGAYQGDGEGEPDLIDLAYVSTNGNDTTGNGSTNTPWGTVGYALANVTPTGMIRVAAGTYVETLQFAADRKGIILQGAYDPDTWAWDPAIHRTTIDGNGGAPVSFAATSDSNTLSCLTLTGGGSNAPGILVSGDVRGLIVDNCRIVSNKYGLSASTVSLIATIRNTLVARNVQYGFYCPSGVSKSGICYLYNCTVADNGSSGFYTRTDNWAWQSVSTVAKNTIFSGNGGYGIENQNTASGSIENCLFFGNARGPTSTRWHGTPLVDLGGNKSGRDPKFQDAAALDYRVALDSPAAAAGADLQSVGVTNDLLWSARPGSSGWDMGVYQGNGGGESALSPLAYVRTGGSDATGNGSQTNPWATVSHALGYTAPSGTIHVAGGVYTGSLHFGPDKKAMVVRGGYNPGTWAWEPAIQKSIIDGAGNVPVLITASATSNTLAYLTLTGGTNSAGVEANGRVSDWLIDGCMIVSNRTEGISGGIFLQRPVIRNSVIAANGSHGIWFNTVVSGGNAGQCYLYNCTIVGNGGSGFMGDFSITQSDVVPVAKNCLFSDNLGYGINKGGNTAGGSMQNCLFYNNSSGETFSVGITLTDFGSNLTTNAPLYVASGSDYRSQPHSPAVDSGTNLTALGVTLDILGVERPQGIAFDRGAYETQLPVMGTIFYLR